MANWKGTAIPNNGAYQTIYINTAFSTEEVVNILEELNFISLGGFETYPVMSVEYLSTGGNEGVNYSDLTVFRTEGQLLILAGNNPIFDSTVGWYDGIETSLINTMEGITFMSTTDSDEGLIPVGDQNEKLSSLFSITPFTQDEPITNLPEFLTGIADAIREVKGTNEKINAQNYKPEILKFKELIGSGGDPEWDGDYSEEGELPKPEGTLEITENGEYDVTDKANVNVNVEQAEGSITQALVENLNVKNFSKKPAKFKYECSLSNGLGIYGSYGTNDKLGVFYINLLTQEEIKIYDNIKTWDAFFEDSKGNVYISSSNTLLYLNGTTVTPVSINGYGFKYFFEDSKGNVYVNAGSYAGINQLNGATATQIFNSGYGWNYFFEDSNGNVYVTCTDGSGAKGVLHVNGSTVIQIYETGTYWKYFFEDSKGNVYVGSSSSSSGKGLLHLNGTVATLIYETGYGWNTFFEDSKGNVYASAINTSAGLLHLNGTVATLIYETGYGFPYFIEDSKGNVYVSTDSSSIGLLRLNDAVATQIYSSGYSWGYFFEDSNGNLYCSSTNQNGTGIIHIINDIVTKIYSKGTRWQYFFEDSKGNVYVSSDKTAGILKLNDTSVTQVYANDISWKYFYENETGLLVAQDEYVTNKIILLFENNNLYELSPKE